MKKDNTISVKEILVLKSFMIEIELVFNMPNNKPIAAHIPKRKLSGSNTWVRMGYANVGMVMMPPTICMVNTASTQ
ncbi:MAG: hypothetical protein KBS93_02860 [Flavobacteriaceae bacterium]|nr:hypothetical protein [Candidatus Onthonaster equi]